jgi:hypothetical protein
MLRLTPSGIVAVSLFTVCLGWSVGALFSVLFAALHLFPPAVPIELFRALAAGGLISVLLARRRLRG